MITIIECITINVRCFLYQNKQWVQTKKDSWYHKNNIRDVVNIEFFPKGHAEEWYNWVLRDVLLKIWYVVNDIRGHRDVTWRFVVRSCQAAKYFHDWKKGERYLISFLKFNNSWSRSWILLISEVLKFTAWDSFLQILLLPLV